LTATIANGHLIDVPIRPIDNERKACDAVTRVLEERSGAVRCNPRYPEKDASGPPVEYVFDLAGKTYAFERQIHTGVDFGRFVAPIEAELDHHMPRPGIYWLMFPIDPCAGLKPRDIPKIQAAIVAWAKAKAAELHAELPRKPSRIEKPRGHQTFRKENLPGLMFELYLSRDTNWAMPDIADGRLFASRFAPPNNEKLREQRLLTAFDRKFPKLAKWKAAGAASVLILENGDRALTNHILVADVVAKLIRCRADRPDQIWFVDTVLGNAWTVWCFVRDDMLFPDEDSPARYREFDPATLNPV
jgi:hypothetical protein